MICLNAVDEPLTLSDLDALLHMVVKQKLIDEQKVEHSFALRHTNQLLDLCELFQKR